MKKIGIILANELRDVDLFIPLTIWRKAKIAVELISIEKKNSIMMESGAKVGCTYLFERKNISPSQYHAIYFPGGNGIKYFFPENWPIKNSEGPKKLYKAIESFRFYKEKDKKKETKYILLTSSSSAIMHHNQLIGNSRIAGYTSDYKLDKNITEEVVISHDLVSVLGYYQLTTFALEVVELLVGKEKRIEIENSLEINY